MTIADERKGAPPSFVCTELDHPINCSEAERIFSRFSTIRSTSKRGYQGIVHSVARSCPDSLRSSATP